MYGKHLSKETRRKMSEAKKGKKPPNWLEFTGEDIAKMKALREAGCTYKEISKKYRVSRRTITRRIKQLERK
jgi:DNA invertase Pin-like site-specific DNA recombinase